MRYSLLVLLCLYPVIVNASIVSDRVIAKAVQTITTAINDDKVLATNPLDFSFEQKASRGYLYFQRALAFRHMAKRAAQKTPLLRRAEADLERAFFAPHKDGQATQSLLVAIRKDLIESERQAKHYASVIDLIDRLPVSDKKSPHLVLYYAEALLHAKRIDHFKLFARNYSALLHDNKAIAEHLSTPPAWQSLLSTDEPLVKTPIAGKAAQLLFTLDDLFTDPSTALSLLSADYYFAEAEKSFYVAADLFFTLSKKERT